jgi:hypothetical protein
LNLAICVPTYNRPEVIEELFIRCTDVYRDLRIDLYIYDSSEGDQTEKVVRRFQESNDFIYFVKIDSSIHSNIKVYNIYQLNGLRKKYDYIWVCADFLRWSRNAYAEIIMHLSENYDILIPNQRDAQHLGDKLFIDKLEFFVTCAWQLTLYGAAILNVKTMLSEVNWDYLFKKYTVPERINHSHVCFYFEKILQLQEFKAFHLALSSDDFYISPIRKDSYWRNDALLCWGSYWPNAINTLPSYYEQKKQEAILNHPKYTGILNTTYVLFLRKDLLYSKKDFLTYKGMWRSINNVPEWVMYLLSTLPYSLINFIIKIVGIAKTDVLLYIKSKILAKRRKVLYIYGAGWEARTATSFLDSAKISFETYIVTDKGKNIRVLNGHEIVEMSSLISRKGEFGILIGTNKRNREQIVKYLDTLGFKENTDYIYLY